jgi:hypothetical protein
MPPQEAGTRRRVGAGCAPLAATSAPARTRGAVSADSGQLDDGPELPATGRRDPNLLVTAGAAAAALALRRLDRAARADR